MDVGTEYGDLAPLVKVAGWLISAAWAIIFVWRGRSGKWAPIEEAIPGGTSRIAGLLTAIGLAVLWWYQSADLTQGRWLLPVVGIAVASLLVGFIASSFALTALEYYVIVADGVRKPIVGGLWLTSNAREEHAKGEPLQEVLEGNEYRLDRVWPRLSRGAANVLLLTLYLAVTVGGSVALGAGAVLMLLSRQPRVAEFSIAPLELIPGESADIRWKVANAEGVTIEPIGTVETQGQRTIQPTRDTATYKLRATNAYGVRGLELGVRFKVAPTPPPTSPVPVSPPPARTTARRPAPRPVPVVVTPPAPPIITDARNCELTRGVVIRGSGWLQAETDLAGLTIARCTVQIPRDGKYQIVVRYASVDPRPVRITLDDYILNQSGLAAATGGWMEPNWKDEAQRVYPMTAGSHVIEFHTEGLFPHIQQIRIERTS